MKAVQDFNYKVALASGLKHLQAGKLRQAEEQFTYLVKKFPDADGGYRGLARVQIALGDKPAAIATLRDGAGALARAGERTVTIDLLRECTMLDPLDLTSHRRLAAALALAGDMSAAAQEYVRFSNAQVVAGDAQRARLEASYALETFGEIPALHDLARSLGLNLRTVRPPSAEPAVPRVVEDATFIPRWATGAGTDATSDVAAEPVAEAAASEATPATTPAEDPFVLEARAMALIGARDPDAGGTAIEAARALIAVGKVQAASDLLLDLVASGIAVHDAERELIGVARALGRSDIAEERERLLGAAVPRG